MGKDYAIHPHPSFMDQPDHNSSNSAQNHLKHETPGGDKLLYLVRTSKLSFALSVTTGGEHRRDFLHHQNIACVCSFIQHQHPKSSDESVSGARVLFRLAKNKELRPCLDQSNGHHSLICIDSNQLSCRTISSKRNDCFLIWHGQECYRTCRNV